MINSYCRSHFFIRIIVIFKNPIFTFVLGAIIFGGIGTVVAATILAKDVTYPPKDTSWKVSNVEDAIDSLYTKANTTISGLNSQITTLKTSNTNLSNQVTSLTGEVANLQSQLNSLTTASTSFHFTSSTTTQTFNLGFKESPKFSAIA